MSAPLDAAARRVLAEVLDSCDPGAAINARLRAGPGRLAGTGWELETSRFDEVRVAAVGKAADAMMAAAAALLDRCGLAPAARRGLVVAHADAALAPTPEWATRVLGDHPVPTERSLDAGRRLLELLDGCTERTLAIVLLSGGGSALAEWPADPRLGAAELAELNELLVRSDLSIRAINAVRKRVSAIKGGRLATRAAPARLLTIVVSDVAPGDVQSVASGPTVLDETTRDEAVEAIERSGVVRRASPALAAALAPAALGDTPRAAELATLRSPVEVVLDCDDVARAAERGARREAVAVVSLGCVDGALDPVVERHLEALARLLDGASDGDVCAVVSSGEVTVEVAGDGLGGRNQHTVLYALSRARELGVRFRELAILSAGTDGRDGPTDAAGAVAGLDALDRGAALGLDAAASLGAFDSYRFFEPLGALVRTGPTGSNVRDVRIFLARR